MKYWIGTTLAFAVLGSPANGAAAQIPPMPENPRMAQTFFGIKIQNRCPDLRAVDRGTRTAVVFWVPRRGDQSQISVKKSSGSDELDAAALACVSKLRFAPATTLGDGEVMDSWQQIELGWADRDSVDELRATSSQKPSAGSARATSPAVTAAPPLPPGGRQPQAGGHENTVTVRVCVDDKGKLQQDPTIVRSSGVNSLDQAAVKIAAAGSAFYRPQTALTGASTPGCAQLAIDFDAQ